MERDEFLSMLDEALELEPGSVQWPDTLDSLDGWNSLAVIGLMALVDERLGISLQPRQIAQCETVADLAGLVGLVGGRIPAEAHV